ncbi:CPBP family intramembrane glutamic endopeptidase [Sphingomonas sp. GCM10030256]|uniref:CPBP family intramembrane glutamic endopeptidase n=1 Tax=Sphingomonas sp. GCM10030256 TaxID=3273427 RepID=UPI00361CBEA6
MISIAAARPSEAASQAPVALAGSIVLSGVAVVAMSVFSTTESLSGDLLHRLGVPLRMLVLFSLATVWLRASRSSWRAVGLRRPASMGKVALLVIAGYVSVGAAFALLTGVVLPILGLTPKTAEAFSGLTGNTGLYIYLLVVVAWGSAAFGEELVFRGFLQSRLELVFGTTRVPAVLAVLTQAVIFGALHSYQGAGGAITAGTTGLIIGLVYIAGGRNLWAPIILHGLIDTVSLSAIYFGVAGK